MEGTKHKKHKRSNSKKKSKKNYLIAIDIQQNFSDAHYHLGKLLSTGLKNDEGGTLVKKPEYAAAIIHYKKAIQFFEKTSY